MDSATRRMIRTADDEKAAAEGCYWSQRHADHVVEFFRTFLRHSKGRWAGQPFELLDWQREDIINPLFGWLRPDGKRRFRSANIWVSKKNGKSTLGAGCGLYLVVGDSEPGAEVYSVANDRKQAKIVHSEAVNMVRQSPLLFGNLHINLTTHTISHRASNSSYVALSANPEGSEGINAHGLLIDELHAWKARSLWDSLYYASTARDQPLRFVISTAGNDVTSVGYEQYQQAKNILSGKISDTSQFAYVREADPSDDINDPAVWRKANPSFGVTISESVFKSELEDAKQTPARMSAFKRYRLGIWSTGSSPFLHMADWDKCKDGFTEEDLLGMECYAGLDLARTRDMTALSLVFPGDDYHRVLVYYWLPEDSVNMDGALPEYRQWVNQKYLDTMPGAVCVYTFVENRFVELAAKFKILTLKFDPLFAEETTQEMSDATGVERESFRQTMINFAAPTAELERLVLCRGIRHNGNPILAWNIGNTQVSTDANGNMRPVRSKRDDKRKIDGAVATIMALSGAMSKESVITTSTLHFERK